MAELRIGLSGWDYKGWAGDFYPKPLPKKRHLDYVASVFDTAEVNGTFYSLKRPNVFRDWRARVPPGFVFAIKGSRFLTHVLRARDPRTGLANFMASGLLLLGDALGPLLWQFPPVMRFEPEALAAFCRLLPRTHAEAAALARHHDHRVEGRCVVEPVAEAPLRHAFEVRDPRMLTPQLLSILREHGHALCFSDTGGKHPYVEDLTADFVYLRLHGSPHCYSSGYGEGGADWWVPRIHAWLAGGEVPGAPKVQPDRPATHRPRTVYVYFDNDAQGHAPFDALLFKQRLGLGGHLGEDITTPDGRRWPLPPRLAG